MRFRFRKSKGIAAEIVISVVILFVVAFVWTLLSQIYVPYLFPTADEVLANYTNASNTLKLIKMAWDFWPLIAVFAIIIWLFVRAQKREFDTAQVPI